MLTIIAVASLEVCVQKNAASTAARIPCSRPDPADLAEELCILDSNSAGRWSVGATQEKNNGKELSDEDLRTELHV